MKSNHMTSNSHVFTVFATLCFLLHSTISLTDDNSQQYKFPAIFNFGDSNSDTGGLTAIYGQAHPPNGETYFGAPAGRFCDGRLMIDFLAECLGLPYLDAYLNSVGSNFSHGANFATAGSTVRPQNTTISQSGYSPVSLDIQFAEFVKFRKASQVVRDRGGVFEGLLPKEEYFAKALYTFDIGQNDITAGYKLNMTTDQVKANVPDIVAQFAKVVRGVYEQGGRSFWVHNTGPMGCLAYILDVYPLTAAQIDKVGCAIPFNEAAQFYNAKLKDVVDELKNDLPFAAITYVDVYSIKYTLISHAEQYGFKEALVACCGHGGKYNFDNAKRCGSTKRVDGEDILIAKSCDNPSIKVIWDGIHYTESANKWIVSQMLNNTTYVDPPVSLKRACHRPA